MEYPRVTIITPSYNQADFIEQTIRSVLEQNYPNLEYMIVDGGSTDGSVEIIRRYAGQLAWWVSEKDSGQAEAINKGFARASGEFVAWVNSDDLLQPGAILAAVEAFQQHPEAGLVYGDVLAINGAGQAINLMKFAPYRLEDLMAFKVICQPGVTMRRAVLEQAGYLDARMHYMLDHHLWLRMVRLAPMVYLARQQAMARYHAAAKNLVQAARFGEEGLLIAAWLEKQPEYASHLNRRRLWGGAYRVNGWYLVEAGQPAAALRSYFHSFRNDPGAALADWRRIVYAGLSLAGLSRLKSSYYRLRQSIRRRTQPEIYAKEEKPRKG
jgi:glycosyltransferase involved in cell wall biosynthesis